MDVRYHFPKHFERHFTRCINEVRLEPSARCWVANLNILASLLRIYFGCLPAISGHEKATISAQTYSCDPSRLLLTQEPNCMSSFLRSAHSRSSGSGIEQGLKFRQKLRSRVVESGSVCWPRANCIDRAAIFSTKFTKNPLAKRTLSRTEELRTLPSSV